MKHTFLLLFSLLILSHCGSAQERSGSEATSEKSAPAYLEVDEIDPGPILRDTLSREQEEQIEYLYGVFSEVSQDPLEKWKTDFQRDTDPDKEIAIWMAMAEAYTQYNGDKELSIEEKLEVYEIILVRSVYPQEEALQSLNLKLLTEEQAIEVMAGYTLAAEPIRVTKEE